MSDDRSRFAGAPAYVVDVDPDAWLESHGHARAFGVLSAAERERARRFRRRADSELYVTAHALLRHELGHALDADPCALVFTADRGRRPELSEPDARGFTFNLSHTSGRVALVVSRGVGCGVDVEHVDRAIELEALAARLYSPVERAWLFSAADDAQARDRFFRLWTAKEAYSKARGLGFALEFSSYEFEIPERGSPRLLHCPEGVAEAARWCFGHAATTPRHRLAWAVGRGPAGTATRVVVRGPSA